MKAIFPALVLAACLASVGTGRAQGLVDPMRPAGAGQADAEVAVARPVGPVLEQVILGDGRRFAVISGKKVALGDKVGNATVVGIGADQVTLRGGTTHVLRMFPRTDPKTESRVPAPQPRKAEEGS
jgi:MSHA biogenesis protein MshK